MAENGVKVAGRGFVLYLSYDELYDIRVAIRLCSLIPEACRQLMKPERKRLMDIVDRIRPYISETATDDDVRACLASTPYGVE